MRCVLIEWDDMYYMEHLRLSVSVVVILNILLFSIGMIVGEYLYCSSKGSTSGTKILIKLSSEI